ncbi:unnamed protein product [Aphanomyces euteiches]
MQEDEYKTIATPKDDQVVQVDAAKPSTNLSKGKASDVDDDFSFLAVYRYADAKDKLLLTAGFICSAVNGAGFPLMAILFGDAINAFVVPVNFDAVHKATLSFLLLAVGLFVAGYGSYACFAVSAERQMKKLRSECLKRIMYQDIGWYDQLDVSELASRISGDTVRIKDGMGDKLGEALRFFCQFLSGYIVGFSRGWNLSLVMACFMPLSSVSVAFLMKRLQQSAIHTQKVYAAAGAVAEETIGAMRTVASLNGEARAMAKYAANVAEAETVTIGVSKFVSVAFGWVFCLIWFTYAIGLWYGGWLVSNQHNTVSDPGTVLGAFYGILIGTMAVGQISPNVNAVAIAKGSAKALFKILESKSDIDASDMNGEIPPTCEGNIEAREVHFAYPSRLEDPILRGYSLTINKGETVAFSSARIDEDDSSAFEEYERQVSMALEAGGPETEESFTALLVRKSSSTSHVSVDKSLEFVGTVERAVKLGRIFELTKPQRLYYIFGVVASCIQGFTVPAIALILSRVISDMNLHYAEYVQSGKNDMAPLTALYDKVAHSAYLFIVAAVVVLVASFVQTYTFRVIAEKLTSRLRKMHFEALLRQDIGFFDLPGHSTGALTTDLSIHATKVVVIAGESQARILQAFFTIAAGLLIAFFMGNWKLALVAAAGQNFADNLADSGAVATEAITNARTVTAFGLQPDFLARYNVFLDIPLKEGTKQGHISGALNGFFSLIMFSVYALILWYDARLMNDGDITLQELMNTLMAIMMGVRALGKLLALSETPTLPGSLKPSKVTGCIEFNDVFFNYPSRPDVKVLRHYDLTIEPGQPWLSVRFYNPTSGSITLDGHDISTLNLHWLRSQIGLVGQEPVLFVGTIAENIASGLSDSVPSTDLQERVEAAAKMANAHNFITQFPDGYQTQVGLKGEQLSGGQKQRIAIARAIMKNPSILLLDESTSALDSESEKVVQEALDKLLAAKGRTTIVIAHRLSTIRHADKICVVSGGRIAEQGTHDQLMKRNGIYTRLVHTNTNN